MKKFVFVLIFILLLSGCEKNSPDPQKNEGTATESFSGETKTVETEEIPDLTGAWVQKGYENRESFMFAAIADEQIEINWSMNNGALQTLYWAGSYILPTEPGPYSWESVNDKSKTDSALFASGDNTKTIYYDDTEISFSVTVSGKTGVITLIPATQEDIDFINAQKKPKRN